MHLVQIFLPLADNDGTPISRGDFSRVREELTEEFGGLTVYSRAPAEGMWEDDGAGRARDDVIVFEVMAEMLDETWWSTYRASLEERFRQDEVLIRALDVRRL